VHDSFPDYTEKARMLMSEIPGHSWQDSCPCQPVGVPHLGGSLSISSKALPSTQQGLAPVYQDAREPDMRTFGQGMIHNLSSAGSDSGAQ
jgi:hypothetical protein